MLSSGEAAAFNPGERGSVFRLRKPLDWGGVSLAVGQSVTVEMVDTATYHRDLGMLLRPVRPLLEGWDTVGLPNAEPTFGMSRGAFFEYLRGESPYPRPHVEAEWPGPTAMRVALTNPTAQASALATTGNWVELRFAGTEVRDVQLGDFGGMEYGRVGADDSWHLTVARDEGSVGQRDRERDWGAGHVPLASARRARAVARSPRGRHGRHRTAGTSGPQQALSELNNSITASFPTANPSASSQALTQFPLA